MNRPHAGYDWIIVGGGLCGSALAYELAREQATVLLIDPNFDSPGATRYSYGGIAYWAGTTGLTRQLCQEARQRHLELSEELGFETQFRERMLLLTVEQGSDPEAIAAGYHPFMVQPEVLTTAEACQAEPLLNPNAIAGALKLPHGHVSPMALVQGYQQAFEQLGGQRYQATVQTIEPSKADATADTTADTTQVPDITKVTGVWADGQHIEGDRIVICAGAWSQRLLHQQGLSVPLGFTHAEMIETPPADFELQAIVMPAVQSRFALEATAAQPEQRKQWDFSQTRPSQPLAPPVLDAGLVQFADGHCCLGQISRAQTRLDWAASSSQSETDIRSSVARQLPITRTLEGQWHSTRVSFCADGLPLVGVVPAFENLFLFSGFSSPFVYVPPLARHFAQSLSTSTPTSKTQAVITAVNLSRFECD